MKRLYLKIYLTIVASLVLVVLIAGAAWRIGPGQNATAQAFDMAGELAGAALPPAGADPAVQAEAVIRLAERLRIDLALFDAGRQPIAAAGRPLPPPPPDAASGWLFGGPGGPAWGFRLPDERWLVARAPVRHRHPVVGLLLFLGTIVLVVIVCAFPVVRGLTRRLERLQQGVETLGAGQLTARVKVEGKDEIARLAASFNRAAARIEELVGAHRMLLANASHELRTPLSRIQLGIDLYGQSGEARYADALKQDIAELDTLIDEILLASRLDATQALQAEPVDLLGLAAEECARYPDCHLDGEPATLTGDPRLLRRLVRNLLENAVRHGRPPLRLELRRQPGRIVLAVIDAGPGIPEAAREQVFTPFYRLAGSAGERGAGLGLALVRQIARLHGGEAVVAPRPDAPGVVEITLPAA